MKAKFASDADDTNGGGGVMVGNFASACRLLPASHHRLQWGNGNWFGSHLTRGTRYGVQVTPNNAVPCLILVYCRRSRNTSYETIEYLRYESAEWAITEVALPAMR